MEINPQVKVIVIIGIILFILSGIPIKIIKDSLKPHQEINQTVNITPPIIIYQTKEVFVYPTIDGNIYFASEYQEGIRKIKRPFSFYRKEAIGLKDLSIHAVIYDYKIFNSYHWFNPTDYKYYEVFPINPENKFLFVFANIYMDDIIADDTRFWIPTEKQFNVQVYETVYNPISFPKQIRIKELEDTFNYNDNSMVTAYNSLRQYKTSNEYQNTAGETFESIDVLKGGKSNAIDGYLLFELDKNTPDEDILVCENFYSFGSSCWKLKP